MSGILSHLSTKTGRDESAWTLNLLSRLSCERHMTGLVIFIFCHKIQNPICKPSGKRGPLLAQLVQGRGTASENWSQVRKTPRQLFSALISKIAPPNRLSFSRQQGKQSPSRLTSSHSATQGKRIFSSPYSHPTWFKISQGSIQIGSAWVTCSSHSGQSLVSCASVARQIGSSKQPAILTTYLE